MKTTTLVLILFLTGLVLRAQTPPSPNPSPLPRRLPARFNGATNNAAVAPAGQPNFPAPGASAVPGLPAAVTPSASPLGEPGASPAMTAGQP